MPRAFGRGVCAIAATETNTVLRGSWLCTVTAGPVLYMSACLGGLFLWELTSPPPRARAGPSRCETLGKVAPVVLGFSLFLVYFDTNQRYLRDRFVFPWEGCGPWILFCLKWENFIRDTKPF